MEVKKLLYMPKALEQKIKKYRFANEFNTEAEAIRDLLEKGLEAGKRKG